MSLATWATAAPWRRVEAGSDVLAARWVDTRAGRLYVRASVAPTPPGRLPVVLVHGQVVSSRYLVPLARHLAPYHPVLAPDLPGYGRSVKPDRALHLDELADALEALLDAEGIDRVAMLGNSYGCQIVTAFAVRHPRRLARAVLQGPTADPRARSAIRQMARWLANAPREPFPLAFVLLRDYRDAGLVRSLGTFRHLLADVIEERLPHVQAPTIIVRGARDPIVPRAWAREAAERLPHGRLVEIPGATHTLVYTAPETLASLTRGFLAEEPPPAEGAAT